VILHYGSHLQALKALYPEVVFKPEYVFKYRGWTASALLQCNDSLSSGYGRSEIRRKFFNEFAKSKRFDPLDADKWYTITKKDVLSAVCIVLTNIPDRDMITERRKLSVKLL
jgi:hypothetical protein